MNHTKTGSGTDLACRSHLRTPDPDYYFFSTFFRFTLFYLNKFIWKGNFTSHQHHLTWIESDHENNIKKQTNVIKFSHDPAQGSKPEACPVCIKET